MLSANRSCLPCHTIAAAVLRQQKGIAANGCLDETRLLTGTSELGTAELGHRQQALANLLAIALASLHFSMLLFSVAGTLVVSRWQEVAPSVQLMGYTPF